MSSFAVRALTVLWPAFFTAGVMEMLVFAMIDPSDLHWIGGEALPLSRQATYTLAFLAFWVLIGSASAVTLWLGSAPRPTTTSSAPRGGLSSPAEPDLLKSPRRGADGE